MKNIIIYSICVLVLSLFGSCELEDQEANKLHGKDGVWVIEKVQYQEFDLDGNTLIDSKVTNAGELIFMSTESLFALYGYYQGVYLNTNKNSGSVMEYMIDGVRMHLRSFEPEDPYYLQGLWSVSKTTSRKQEWVIVTTHPEDGLTIKSKKLLVLKAKNAF